MQFSRRCFLKSSGLAFVGLGFVPQFLDRALAQSSNARGKILVVLFQRGAADSLSMVPPFGDSQYYAMRPTIALSPPGKGADSAIRLNDTFGLHPALSALQRFWEEGNLAIVQGVGSPNSTRSHGAAIGTAAWHLWLIGVDSKSQRGYKVTRKLNIRGDLRRIAAT